jgi:hypothetical protein
VKALSDEHNDHEGVEPRASTTTTTALSHEDNDYRIRGSVTGGFACLGIKNLPSSGLGVPDGVTDCGRFLEGCIEYDVPIPRLPLGIGAEAGKSVAASMGNAAFDYTDWIRVLWAGK